MHSQQPLSAGPELGAGGGRKTDETREPCPPEAPSGRVSAFPAASPCLPLLLLLQENPPQGLDVLLQRAEQLPLPSPTRWPGGLVCRDMTLHSYSPGTQHRTQHRAVGRRNLVTEQGRQLTPWLARPPDNTS